ncbi:MAG: aldehyde dehydrogenase family protein [Eubacteriaceae bacterium]|nr:aldehyde dehydrogenase family protein [Eubacteriaceae bacterium]
MEKKKYISDKYQLFIGGKWIDAEGGKVIDVFCPADGEKLTTIADAGKGDVDRAVKAAEKAAGTWGKTSPAERAIILNKVADIMEENLDRLSMIETLDNGKALRENLTFDMTYSIDHFRYFAGAIRAEEGKAAMLDNDNMNIILREPLGVVGQIVPWNFPMLMAAWKIAPALATGNTIVFKPSSETSLSVLELAKMTQDILPAGVLNIVTGRGAETGQAVLDHPDIKKLAFTGSTEVGYEVARAVADKLIPATLELGGKSPDIFLPDIKEKLWDKALEGCASGILWNAGQVCCAGSRAIVHKDIYDEFVEALVHKFEATKVGIPWEDGIQVGTIINETQVKKILDYVEIGKKEGARLATGGYRLKENGLGKGCFIAPTILADVDRDMRVAQEEIFGPVLVIIKAEDIDDAIEIANDSDYGLGGAVWSQDINAALRVAREVQTGTMWINHYGATPAHTTFGGYKKSGLGRETHLSMMDSYSNIKSIQINFPEGVAGTFPG